MMRFRFNAILLILLVQLTACGGGGGTTTGTGGAPDVSKKCIISQLQSSLTTGSVSKAKDSLSANFNLSLTQATSIDVTSNFENSSADDWIEAYPQKTNLAQGDHQIVLKYDLNSPSKTVTDRYTKLNVTVTLPGDEACVANSAVNITLTP